MPSPVVPLNPCENQSLGMQQAIGSIICVNLQTIAISDSGNGIQIVIRKKGASIHAVKSAYVTQTIRNRSGTRRAAGVVAQLAKRGYRPDLRAVSVPLSCTSMDVKLGRRYTRHFFVFSYAPSRARWTS